MPYAEGRIFNDADSHIMETRDWLISHADPDIRTKLHPLAIGSAGKLVEKAIAHADERQKNPAAVADAEQNLMLRKGWEALGAFDPDERRRALDLLGFNSQLVFTTFAITHFWGEFEQVRTTPEVLYGGTRAHNRAIADFCHGDKRLLGVGFVPLDIPELAEKEIDEAIRLGCAAIHIPSLPPGKKSPTHPDYNGVWARLQDADVPFMLHVGGGGRAIPRAFHNNDRPVTDFLGGGENIRSKDFMAIHMMPEIFLSTMVLDGIVRAVPAAARRMHRAGRDVDRAVAAPPRHLAGDVREIGKISAPADEGVRLRAPQSALHALSARARGMDRRAGRPGPVHVLVGLPAYRGRAQSAQALRAVNAESFGGAQRKNSTPPTSPT